MSDCNNCGKGDCPNCSIDETTFKCLVCKERCAVEMQLYNTGVCQECAETIVNDYLDLHQED